MDNIIALSSLGLALAMLTGQAQADVVNANFQVKITIQKVCSVTAGAASDIDFGAVPSSATVPEKNSVIKVKCTKTTPYYVGLTPSNNSTKGEGVMTEPVSGSVIPYQLRSVSAGAVWGNTATTTSVGNGVGGTGNGADQPLTVYATVPSADAPPGAYVDTVTVSVNY